MGHGRKSRSAAGRCRSELTGEVTSIGTVIARNAVYRRGPDGRHRPPGVRGASSTIDKPADAAVAAQFLNLQVQVFFEPSQMRRTPLARLNLLHERTRTLVAVAGVAFAALLIFVQLGFLGAVRATATLIYDRLDFDVAVLSVEYQDLVRAGTFPRDRLPRVRGLPGVAAVRPISVWGIQWLNNADESRRRRGILVIGVDPADCPVQAPGIDAGAAVAGCDSRTRS